MDKGHEYTFLKRRYANGQEIYEKISHVKDVTSLVIRNMQIKTTSHSPE